MVAQIITKCEKTTLEAIPQDWKLKKIGDFADVTSGGTPSTFVPAYWNGNIRWMNSGELNLKKIFEVEGRITEYGLKNSSTKMLPSKCVLIGLAGQGKTRGTIAINYVGLCPNQSIGAVLPNDFFIPEYLYYNLDSRYNELRKLSTGEGGLNLTIIRNIEVPLPTKEEQSAIAKVLSDTDALIESFDRLIEKKKNIKQGAMQELLTGKKRLPGKWLENQKKKSTEVGLIPEDWNVCSFTDIVSKYIDYRGITPKKLGMEWRNNGEILALSANNVKMGKIDSQIDANYGDESLYKRWMTQGDCEQGDLVITMEAPLGNIAQIPNKRKYILSQRVILVKPIDAIDRTFLFHYLRGSYFQNQLLKNSTGSTALGIQRKKLNEILIYFPPEKSEQSAIAQVLSDMDSEITEVEQKRDKFKQLKAGMMQQLLTGRIRLKCKN